MSSDLLCVFGMIQQAYEKCFQNLHHVERHEEHTIAHAVQTSYKKTKVFTFPPCPVVYTHFVDYILFPEFILAEACI